MEQNVLSVQQAGEAVEVTTASTFQSRRKHGRKARNSVPQETPLFSCSKTERRWFLCHGIHSSTGLDCHTYLKRMAGTGKMEQLFPNKRQAGLFSMTTSSVPPFMGKLFTPATLAQQSSCGSVRKWLLRSPEEALKEEVWDLPLSDAIFWKQKFFLFLFVYHAVLS